MKPRYILILIYATAASGATAVASAAIHSPHIWPGALYAFVVTALISIGTTRRRQGWRPK